MIQLVRARPAHAPRPDRLLGRACLVLAVPAVLWFLVNLVHPVGPPALLWLTIPAFGPVLTVIFWRTSRAPHLPPGTQRFWRHLSPVPLLIGAAHTFQAGYAVTHPRAPDIDNTTTMYALDGAGMLLVVYALIRLPQGAHGRGTVIRMVLDACTVTLAAAAFIWHFTFRLTLDTTGTPAVTASLILVLFALLIAFTLTKVMLSESSAIDARGLRRVAGAAGVGALSPVVQPLLSMHTDLHAAQFYLPVVFSLGAQAALVQWDAVAPARPRRRRRPYSVLPYTAVAAVDGLLLWVCAGDRTDLVAVAATAVALTTLVATRQATALRDNARLLDRLDHLANHDPLTGVANRALVQRRLHEALARTPARSVAVALLDLDGFKAVNDSLGHEAGDLLLISVARRLTDCVRAGDTVARLGGDEFVVLLDGADRAMAGEIVDRVVAALCEPVRAAGRDLPIRASIGIAGGDGGTEADELMRRADLAMYAAKKVPGTVYLHHDDVVVAAAAA